MRRRFIRSLVGGGIATLVCVLASCDRAAAPVTAPSETAPPVRSVQVEPLAQTRANRTTHVCVDPSNNLYWSQESDDGHDVMFMLPNAAAPATESGNVSANISRATELSSGNILAAMERSANRGASSGSNPTRQTGTGTIQSLAAGPDGEIYFFFSGGVGRATRVCLGRFDAEAGSRDAIRILADTAVLADATRMGGSLGLARGELIVQRGARATSNSKSATRIVLLVRHSDAWALFRFDARLLSESGMIPLARSKIPGMSTDLRRADTRDPINLAREDYELSAGPGDSLLISDRGSGLMMRVDASGKAAPFASMIGFPDSFSSPFVSSDDMLGVEERAAAQASTVLRTSVDVAPPAEGYAILFAPPGNAIDPRRGERADPPDIQVTWPALLSVAIRVPTAATDVLPSGRWAALDRDDLRAPAEFAVHAMRLRQLVPIDPGSFAGSASASIRTTAAFVGYDGASGQLLRLRVVEKR